MHTDPRTARRLTLPIVVLAVLIAGCAGEAEPGPVVTLQGGVRYQILKPGRGDTVRVGDTITAHYTLWLPDGTLLQSSKEERGGTGVPLTRRIGRGELIPGWDMAVPGMTEGEVRKLWIPSEYAYGERGSGSVIPPNTDLTFEMEIVRTRR